ncbi:hypothetical protein LTS08_008746 [Lithohypha guttulata]|uniref:beta-glucosidase n=1 Tax=Lithohypha guttulata TaxID=1690604 RepID=A0AAN7SL85_9EURO|nr:hypothetical protein LTR05_008803 [Lithohypha guttulata]KAK5094087.1 hypothetical protein LTS08_008746 [Lithohypha guttulata]
MASLSKLSTALMLCLLPAVHPQEVVVDGIVQEDVYFYGQSPPVFPSPETNATGLWADAISRARDMVARMTLDEKVSITGGIVNSTNGCGGNIPSVERVGFPGMCLQDGANGVRETDFVNGYASGVHVGASWNRNLTYARAHGFGGEFRRKGATVALGPMIGPLGRIALGGRNWEGFSPDPYLSGILVAETVHGIQDQGVIATTKHFVGNEQELLRNPRLDASNDNKTIEASSTNMDDQTMHELYMWPFADAVHAGTGSIMGSYQRLNNSYACHNSKALNGLLKTELGFPGFVMSDWFAQHAGVASALGGLDMVMPFGFEFWGDNLTEAVANSSIPELRVDDMATRVLAAWYLVGQDTVDIPMAIGIPPSHLRQHPYIDARDPADDATILQGAIEGHVLVKNTNNVLPLRNPRMISVFGYDAKNPNANTPAQGFSGWSTGLQSQNYVAVVCGFGTGYGPRGAEGCPPFLPIGPNGTMITGGGSGAATSAYIDSPIEALQRRARRDKTAVFWDFDTVSANSTVDRTSDACLVFLNAASSEGIDRPALRDDFSDTLVTNIAAQCNNTIVVIHNAGVRLVDQWIENENVTALIFAQLPGQDSGEALTQILYGDVSPSGKLTYTVPRNESDYGNLLEPVGYEGWDRYFPQDNFTEGVFIDYRHFDQRGIEPRYEFGFGLSYTTFEYSNLNIEVVTSNLTEYPVGQIIPGGQADLWDVVARVSATVSNTGGVEAAEVVQLYLGVPGGNQPIRQLRGFDKAVIPAGQSRDVSLDLRRRDVSAWDVVAQQWRVAVGQDYIVEVGASSRNLPLNGTLVF